MTAVDTEWVRQLEKVGRAYERAAAVLESARVERDEVVRAAVEAGVPQSHIAGAVGLSRMHVHRVARGD